ncbi:hypothetical protein A2U01_0090775, partial [Trifolium medium]|nr:hypothetical protein [Trifolium medium]
ARRHGDSSRKLQRIEGIGEESSKKLKEEDEEVESCSEKRLENG